MGKAFIDHGGGGSSSIKGDINGFYDYNNVYHPIRQAPTLIKYQYQTGASYTYTFTQNYEKVLIYLLCGDSDNNNDNSGSVSGTGFKTFSIKQTLTNAQSQTVGALIDAAFGTTITSNLDTYHFGFMFYGENIKANGTVTISGSHGRKNHFLI